jgi:hypothetical protein
MKSFALFAAALLILAACAPRPTPPAALDGAVALVRSLYGAAPPDSSPEGLKQLYTPELAAALIAAMDPARPDPLGFDMRYGDADWTVTGVSLTARPAPDGAVVAARFTNAGLPTEIDWRLIRTAAGWRIAEVSAPELDGLPAWSLRALLKLPPLR